MKSIKIGAGVAFLLAASLCVASVIGLQFERRTQANATSHQSAATIKAAAMIRVNGSQPRIPGVPLRITGEIRGLYFPGAGTVRVIATVAGQSFQAMPFQDNRYTFDLGHQDASQMVVVEVLAPQLRFRSVLGTFGRLAALAGSDGHLELSEHPSLRISPYTTALAALQNNLLGGRDAASDAEFEQTTRVVASGDLQDAAYAVAGITRQEWTLPAAFDNAYELLRNRNAFRDFANRPYFRAAAYDYLFKQDELAPVATLDELPNRLVLIDGVPADGLPIYPGNVLLLDRRPDGNFDLNEQVPLLNPVYAARVDGLGNVQFTPIGTQVRPYLKTVEGVAQLQDRTTVGHTLERLTRGDAVSVWVMRSVWLDRPQFEPSAVGTQEIEYRVFSSVALDTWSTTGAWASLGASSRSLPWMCSAPISTDEVFYELSKCGYVEHRFEANLTGTTVEHGWKMDPQTTQPVLPIGKLPFTWSVENQRVLKVADGKIDTSFWNIQGGHANVGAVLFLSRALLGGSTGKTMVGMDMAGTKTIASSSSWTATGDWRSGYSASAPFRYTARPESYALQRLAGGSGKEQYQAEGLPANDPLPLSWQVSGNAVYDRRTQADHDAGGPFVADCAAAWARGALTCYTRVRYFKPLTKISNRYYGIEEVYAQIIVAAAAGQAELVENSRLVSRPAFYECTGGACASVSTGLRASRNAQIPIRTPGNKLPGRSQGLKPLGRASYQVSQNQHPRIP